MPYGKDNFPSSSQFGISFLQRGIIERQSHKEKGNPTTHTVAARFRFEFTFFGTVNRYLVCSVSGYVKQTISSRLKNIVLVV